MAKKTRVVKCSEEFVELLEDIKKKYEEKYNIEISFTQITSLIANKIKNVGGVNI